MSYYVLNIIDQFENISLDTDTYIDYNKHYISLIIIYIDRYGHWHILRKNNKEGYYYQAENIYDENFKFKKDIKSHIANKFGLYDIKRVKHFKNIDTNHIYGVILNNISYDMIKGEVSSTNDITWHIHYNLNKPYKVPILYNMVSELIIDENDIHTILAE